MDLRIVGSRVSDLRSGRKWTQRKLAEAANCSRSTIIDLESGALVSMQTRVLEGIAAALDTSVEKLIAKPARRHKALSR